VTSLTTYVVAAAVGTTVLAFAVWYGRRSWVRRGISDPLTGLANRKLFESRLAHAQLRARRHDYWVAVLAIDVDELATVNNTMGRECGDQLLRDVADRLRRFARDEDTVARISSDEFAVLLEQVDSPTGAARAARRILDAFQTPLILEGRAVATSLSIGISVQQGGTTSGEGLIREAGIALARAKARGKRRFETFEPPMGIEAAARLKLEAELQQAVDRDEVQVHYQPIVDVGTGLVVGAEALARWAHPERGLLFPIDFIPAAETSGVIIPLGRHVLREACRAAVAFGRLNGSEHGFGINVNVSTRQFREMGTLIADVDDALADSGLPPQMLTLELTESSLLDDVLDAADVVRRLRQMQVHVALDDFGTGYSSLAYIRRIPVSGLKIDRSFVADLDDPATSAIVKAILTIAQELDITVTAEGAETLEQVGLVRSHGCRLVQGHFYGDAIPEAAFTRLMQRRFPKQRDGSVRPLRTAAG
jgi:diguanylate cyclase (GGDEF)-like protein